MTNRVISVWYQPKSDRVEECIAIEVEGKQKRYVRYWPSVKDPHWFEYGWKVHPTAICIWRNSDISN